MTTLISMRVKEGLALFSDTSITYPVESGKPIGSGEIKQFTFHSANGLTFVLQISGELDFPRLKEREYPVSDWIQDFFQQISNLSLFSIEEFSELINERFINRWNSLSVHPKFSSVTFWISGLSKKRELRTVALEYLQNLESRKAIMNTEAEIYSYVQLPGFKSPACSHFLLEKYLWGNSSINLPEAFQLAIQHSEELSKRTQKASFHLRSFPSILITYTQAEERIGNVFKIIECYGEFIKCRDLQSAVKLPIESYLIRP